MAKWYVEESYGGIYEAESENEAFDCFETHNEMQTSHAYKLIGNGKPDFQIMGAKLDNLSDAEKEFYLWHLLRFYYKRKLQDDKAKHANDSMSVDQISRLLNNVEEIDTLLTYDLF